MHIAISVLPGIHLHLGELKYVRMKNHAEEDNIWTMSQHWEAEIEPTRLAVAFCKAPALATTPRPVHMQIWDFANPDRSYMYMWTKVANSKDPLKK